MKEIVRRGHLPDPEKRDRAHEHGIGTVETDPAQDNAVDDKEPVHLLVDGPEPGAAHLRGVQPGHEHEDQDGAEHGDHPDQLGRDEPDVERDRPEDRVERRQVPFGHDVGRRLQGVGLDVVVGLNEKVGREKHEAEEDQHEHAEPEQVLDRVVGMERKDILRSLGVDPQRVVGMVHMERPQVQEHQAEDHEGQQVVQREEAVERRVVHREPAPQPSHDRLADQRKGGEHVGDHGGGPEAHLPPRQHIAQEGRRHHGQEDDNADDPQHLARGLVRAVIEAAEDVDVDDGEEHGPAVHVHVAYQPAVVDVAHDALDALEGVVHMRRVVHGQDDPGDDHDGQRDSGQRAEVPPVGQVLRRRVVDQMFLREREDRQAVFDPLDDGVVPGR